MKNLRFVAALVAIVPVFALMPACSVEQLTETEPDPLIEEIDTPEIAPEGTIGFCDMDTFVGAGSCVTGCTRGSSCGINKWNWTCYAWNYEHWKNYPQGADFYYRTTGPFPNYNFCQAANPSNCPGFCN